MIWVSYFRKHGIFHSDKRFFIPTEFIEKYEEKEKTGEHGSVMNSFRKWLEEEIKNKDFIAVVMDDGQNDGIVGDILGYPMMVMPRD